MKKFTITIFLLLASLSMQAMSLRPLVKSSTKKTQKLATIGSTQNMTEYMLVPAAIVGIATGVCNAKLALDIIDARNKAQDWFHEKEQKVCKKSNSSSQQMPKIKLFTSKLKAPNEQLFSSNMALLTTTFLVGAGVQLNDQMVNCLLALPSLHVALCAARHTSTGFYDLDCANEKIKILIQERSKIKKIK